jgi:hypothetical protein
VGSNPTATAPVSAASPQVSDVTDAAEVVSGGPIRYRLAQSRSAVPRDQPTLQLRQILCDVAPALVRHRLVAERRPPCLRIPDALERGRQWVVTVPTALLVMEPMQDLRRRTTCGLKTPSYSGT